MIFRRTKPAELPFDPYLSPTGEVKMMFWVYPTFAEDIPEPPVPTIGVTSNGFGLLFLTGRDGTAPEPPEPPANSLNYYASDGTTLLLTIPITTTFTGTLYDQPITF